MTDGATPVLRRFFVALRPDPVTTAALLALPAPATLRRTHRDDLHLTLAFLGDLPPDRVPVVAGLVAGMEGGAELLITLDRVEYWRAPRVLVAAGDASADARSLVERLAAALASAGLAADPRPWQPHVTLGRGPGAGLPTRLPLGTPIRWRGEGIGLYASTEPPQRPRYRLLNAGTHPSG